MNTKTILCLLVLSLSVPAHAVAVPILPKPNFLNVAVVTALTAVGWVMTEGVKTKKLVDADAEGYTQSTENATTKQGALPDHASYPLEYIVGDQAFNSLGALESYMKKGYLDRKNLAFVRDSRGIFYYNADVYLGNTLYGGIGYVRVALSVTHKTNVNKHKTGGYIYHTYVPIYFKGSESIENVNITGDYKAQRDKAIADLTAELLKAQSQAEQAKADAEADSLKKAQEQADALALSQAASDAAALQQDMTELQPSKIQSNTSGKTTGKLTSKPALPEPDKPIDIDLPKAVDVPIKELSIKDPQQFDKTYIRTAKQCPPDVVKSFDTGFRQNEIRFEMKPICDFAQSYMRPVIIFIAYLMAIMIISSGFKIG